MVVGSEVADDDGQGPDLTFSTCLPLALTALVSGPEPVLWHQKRFIFIHVSQCPLVATLRRAEGPTT